KDYVYLCMQTTVSSINIAMCAKTHFFINGHKEMVHKKVIQDKAMIGEEFTIKNVREGSFYTIDKLVTLYTSIDKGVEYPFTNARTAINETQGFQNHLRSHVRAWFFLWNKVDIKINGDRFAQRVVRLHLYHLLTTASLYNRNIDAGMPARGLHGEAYRGHIFWDEVYILPFYNMILPEVSRALLMYRYRRLDAAIHYAQQHNYPGAMYPWQTADDGSEETQIIHYNPLSDKWDPDLSSRQRHVSIAIFYNIWEYYSHAKDVSFLHNYGAEMMLQIARFWSGIAFFDKQDQGYHISGVMGPDEYHEKYPNSKEAGLKDNAYTNIMVVWLLEKAIMIVEDILSPKAKERIFNKIQLKEEEIKLWKQISTNMKINIGSDQIVEQFAGYRNLDELDWEDYRQRYNNIQRLDRILKSENKKSDDYQLSKQADFLMTFYLITPQKVKEILNRLGYTIQNELDLLEKNYHFYLDRTSHGSTLSKVVHADISHYLPNLKDNHSWEWFLESLRSDIYDTQGGTTSEGIHCGVMAGTINIIIRNFAGISFNNNRLTIRPQLPKHWTNIALTVLYQGCIYRIEISHKQIHLKIEGQVEEEINICINKKEYTLLSPIYKSFVYKK
ncbi:MAG: beta-phosphoglucomutase, partial [Spirochaetes bacterium]|nr:beta-phosphoglucomutase [Spirochaetota bacterium]